MNYNLSECQLEYIDFSKLNKKEAKKYFEGFINEIPNRLNILNKYISAEDPDIKLDYSCDSLVKIWEWFESKLKMVEYSDEEYAAILKQYPEWVWDYILNKHMDEETMNVAVFVAIYYAEFFRKENPSVYWDIVIKPKSDVDFNYPALFGFKNNVHLNPLRIIYVLMLKSAEKKDKNRLYNNYLTWIKDIDIKNNEII